MTREWKVGDRFSVEGVITAAPDCDGDYQAIFDGHTTGGCVLAAEMQHAKLIAPAAPETQKLDVTKPIRNIHSGEYVKYIGRLSDGRIVVEEQFCESPQANTFWECELENIPGPKRTYEQIVELVPFSDGPRIVSPGNPLSYVNVASRAKVSYTDGEGWSVEEVL